MIENAARDIRRDLQFQDDRAARGGAVFNLVVAERVAEDIGVVDPLLPLLAQEIALQKLVEAAFQVLEAHLEGREWLAGNGLTNADISCCSYLYYPEPFGFERADWPNIDAWLTRISETPGWKHPYDLMPGSPADRA